jgi:hypothetical protein
VWRVVFTLLKGNPASERAFRRPTGRWRNRTKTDFRKICRYFVDWVHLARDNGWWLTVVNRAVNLQEFQSAEQLLAS